LKDFDLIQAQQYIKTYDEKLETQKFKFGVIYQRRGQVENLFRIKSISHDYFSRQQKKNFLIMKDMDDH
jgi:hypothetical protein